MAQRRRTELPVSCSDQKKLDIGLNFQNAANEVSKLYHQAVNFEKLSFDAGQKHSLAKVHEWVSSQIQEGKSVTSAGVMTYLQHELNNPSLVPRLELETQGSGSNESLASRNLQIEANSGSSCSIAPMQSHEPGGNVPCSQDQDMEAMQEDPGHM